MINEEGQSVGNDGKIRDVELDADANPTTAAVAELRREVREELGDIKQALANIYLAIGNNGGGGGGRRARQRSAAQGAAAASGGGSNLCA